MKRKILATLLIVIATATSILYIVYIMKEEETETFSLKVRPQRVDYWVPGENCILLASVINENNEDTNGKSVEISVTCSKSDLEWKPKKVTPEQLCEISVVPHEDSLGENLTVTVKAERKGFSRESKVTMNIIEWGDPPREQAEKVRDSFINWLAEHRPDLDITQETEWEGELARPRVLVVSYYTFYSAEWEMGVWWHVMTAPDDWAKIYLRRRYEEIEPSLAFQIDSFKTEPQPEPNQIEPPDNVWR